MLNETELSVRPYVQFVSVKHVNYLGPKSIFYVFCVHTINKILITKYQYQRNE